MFFFVLNLPAQVIWFEDFNYSNGTTTGANNNTANPANDWTSACSTCLSGDHWEVRTFRMEGNDTNGPAWLETEEIDISAFPGGIQFSVDILGQGDFEGCPGGSSSGCNSIDWVRVRYSLDGGGYVDCTHANGGPCTGSCAGDTYVVFDDFTDFTFTQCPLTGNTLQLRIEVQNWAGTEFLRIDNIVVEAQSCLLPVGITDFHYVTLSEGLELRWESEWEGVDFELQRSVDGRNYEWMTTLPASAGVQADKSKVYTWLDTEPMQGSSWYRLRALDANGTEAGNAILRAESARENGDIRLYPNPAGPELQVQIAGDARMRELQLIDLHGRVLQRKALSQSREETLDIRDLPPGMYLLRVYTEQGSVVRRFIRE